LRHNGDMKPDTVTASEIAEFVFCPEAWRLAQNGHQSANRAVQVAGTDHHTAKATAERVAGGSIAVGRLLIVAALLALLAVVLWR
jgi:hypothetical protein